MFRYLALIWDACDRQQSEAAQLVKRRVKAMPSQWHEALEHGGLAVFCCDIQNGSLEARVLPGRAGVVLGALFERTESQQRDAPCPKAALDEQQAAAIVASRGRWLATHCWGNFVAFIADPLGGGQWVFKDPCGSLPCFSTTYAGLTIVFSAISDCLDLRLLSFTLNRRYLQTRLVSGDMTQECDALNEISQVRRGECARFDPRKQPAPVARHAYWHPLQFPGSDEPIVGPGQAAGALRSTLRACTWSLAGCHESLLLRLSGGLDSSIVLGCLKAGPSQPRLLSYTQYIPDSPSDPRPWARMAVEQAACEHLEVKVVPTDVRLDALLCAAPSAEPLSALMYLVVSAQEQRLAAERRATAVFTGDGGDCAFGSLCIAEAPAAYLRRNGWGSAAFRLASQSALALRQTTWAVLFRAARAWLLGPPSKTITQHHRQARTLVAPEILYGAAIERDPHPWFSRIERVPWETVSKLGALLATPDLYAGTGLADAAAPEPLTPIYSQPLIELCLRIPADVLFADGRDRGLARRAFVRDVPRPILERIWKDRAGSFHDQLVYRHLDWLRSMFLDGFLVREGFLDRLAVERALSSAPGRGGVYAGEILRHLDTEIWARQWAAQFNGARRAA